MDFIVKVKGVLFEPTNTLSNSREDSLIEALKYYIILVIINSVLYALVMILFGEIISSMMGKYFMIPGDMGGVAGYLVYLLSMNLKFYLLYLKFKSRVACNSFGHNPVITCDDDSRRIHLTGDVFCRCGHFFIQRNSRVFKDHKKYRNYPVYDIAAVFYTYVIECVKLWKYFIFHSNFI